jgi:hypothetical protein
VKVIESGTKTYLTNYVVCLKWGDKYSPEYVNKLNRMVERNLTLPYEFVCFTDDSTGIDKDVRIESLPPILVKGWWFKPYFFNPELILKGTILFLDLDLVVFENIDCLFTYKPKEFLIIRDFNRKFIKNYDRFNSSVFRLEVGSHSHVYTNFVSNPNSVMGRFRGDQDWLYYSIKNNYNYWPDEWIQSYKWEMRSKSDLTRLSSGKLNFKARGEPIVNKNTKIAVFHGDPNPHECKDHWCERHWR